MKINAIQTNTIIKTPYHTTKYNSYDNHTTTRPYENKSFIENYKNIPFKATYIPTKNLSIKIESDKTKLLRKISEILDKDLSDQNIEDFITNSLNRLLTRAQKLAKRKKEIEDHIMSLELSQVLGDQQKLEEVDKLGKEYKQICKTKLDPKKIKVPEVDTHTDFVLLNKFRSAILNENYNLLQIYNNYYSKLLEAKTIDDISNLYPKLPLPPKPEEIIAKKIVNSFTRDFFVKLNQLIDLCKEKETKVGEITPKDQEYIDLESYKNDKVYEACELISQKYGIDSDNLFKKIIKDVQNEILNKFSKIIETNSFSMIPTTQKSKESLVDKIDINLLQIDYNKFVISTLKQMFLEGKKASQIIYEENNVKIPISSLSNTVYKFEKPSEKIKSFITASQKIQKLQRNYDQYSITDLKNRLNHYSNTDLANNENIFETIIDFDSSQFATGDIKMLKHFLSLLDEISDEKITINDAVTKIKEENIRPLETDAINKKEKQTLAEIRRLEQAKIQQLTSAQENFDNIINMLYSKGANSIANKCIKYRPTKLEKDDKTKTDKIIEIIKEHIYKDNTIENIEKLEYRIDSFDTYNYYSKMLPDSNILKRAQSITQEKNGNYNEEKAGQFLMNYDLISNYPESKELARSPEILEKIMDKNLEQEDAIKYLSKYDNYSILSNDTKSKISSFIGLFDIKDSIDKMMLKYIIENDYINTETIAFVKLNDKGNDTIKSIITQTPKKEILERYKFPNCIEYFINFENALSTFASAKGSSGIKRIGDNNDGLKYKIELKITPYIDRLVCSNNNYVFDIYLPKGFHNKLK